MTEIQEFFTRLVYNISLIIPLGYAFGAGMVSTVNPCGFAMLPAYLGLYLGSRNLNASVPAGAAYLDSATASAAIPSQLTRAVLVSLVITGGFLLLFGAAGVVISAGGQLIGRIAPWVALAIGGQLVLFGIAMLPGRHFTTSLAARLAERLGNPGKVSVWGFFIFGVAYATASLSCTLPVFLIVVGGSLVANGFGAAVLQFVSYALGMGLVILFLTLSIALFRGAIVTQLRTILPYVERGSALLMIGAGVYIVYYWLIKGGLLDTMTQG